ncbi:MAG: ATP-dependent DNA helicase [Myxococcaceae bacterium]
MLWAVPGLSADAVFVANGLLSQTLPHHEFRPEQLALARAVEKVLAARGTLVAEAGTGVGKTLAYLVPAALSGRRVLIATATKTLQDQVFQKDLPLLRKSCGLDVHAALLKGRSNYLCWQRFESFRVAPELNSRAEAQVWTDLESWALKTQTGDRAEARLPEDAPLWNRVTRTAESCLGPKCGHYEACFVTRARKAAEDAQILVVNHHLFFADLALRARPESEGVLPPYDAVVFDEAHSLEDVVTEYFGFGVSSYRLGDFVDDALKTLPKDDARAGMLSALALKLRGAGDALFNAASKSLGLERSTAVRLTPQHLKPWSKHMDETRAALSAVSAFVEGRDEVELATLARRGRELSAHLDFLSTADALDHVYWAEARGAGVFLRAAPIGVADTLRNTLHAQVDTQVFVSATLRVGEGFDFFTGRLGIEGARTLALDSPFDYRQQAAIFVPRRMPEPNAPEFVAAVAKQVAWLCELTSGRAFILFTSLRNMHAVHALLRDASPFPLLLQGEMPKAALLEAFRERPSVLLASQSFWEGVDVAGEALSLVVMDKLPFSSPTDPLVAARIDALRDAGEEPFSQYQLPQAAIALRQGFGRLIRRRSDRGIVAVLDARLWNRRYGKMLLGALPPAPCFDNEAGLGRWAAQHLSNLPEAPVEATTTLATSAT